ncbi:alpha/beta hydrolase [Mangrovibacillus cuniculi]|uniref:Alpha/beta fold hydrolase n=1 Tax=Mangrovibacillus cuniculi TaxID=2593652 RepID=A0A7S8CE63_9BACI|nr:alpha/beta fold hydrolase [Mangrovibacillus cuniculi]QPC48178.1 alpha/beta fold hydrolase [Mangrovibacillus cuniculi]
MSVGLLCIHGFTGGPFEVEPLATYLSDKTDWDISVITLEGHSENGVSDQVSAEAWVKQVNDAYDELASKHDQVAVVGFSMGGLLAIELASKKDVQALVLLSAAARYVSPIEFGRDAIGLVKARKEGTLQENEFYRRMREKVGQTPSKATLAFMKMVRLARPCYSCVEAPTFIAQGKRDPVVDPSSAIYLAKKIASEEKELFLDEEAKHVICLSPNRDVLFERVEKFLHQHLA